MKKMGNLNIQCAVPYSSVVQTMHLPHGGHRLGLIGSLFAKSMVCFGVPIVSVDYYIFPLALILLSVSRVVLAFFVVNGHCSY